ncbi:tetratricopeptide repeat protein [Aneurinibacillus tyrosinisolvens]|uniref:tetratricopeptide repeat protein n=1 Tax=Aneurinibacillus tyrosinisolvens TaxID=1443435 RepID=UPI00063FB796|nr:tetratricopeptide repeat protein [Aneurinibacillus tyrosinisolvens]
MNVHISGRKFISHTREKFLERTKKVVSGTHVNPLYINTADPAYYEKLLRCNSNHVQALYQIGRKYEKQGQFSTAERYYARAVQADSHFEPALGALVLLRRKMKREYVRALQKEKAINKAKLTSLSLLPIMGFVLLGYLLVLLLLFGIVLH